MSHLVLLVYDLKIICFPKQSQTYIIQLICVLTTLFILRVKYTHQSQSTIKYEISDSTLPKCCRDCGYVVSHHSKPISWTNTNQSHKFACGRSESQVAASPPYEVIRMGNYQAAHNSASYRNKMCILLQWTQKEGATHTYVLGFLSLGCSSRER